MTSRQERRNAERDTSKRAPGQAGAGRAGGAVAARADVNTNPVGDWTTQAEDPWLLLDALGDEIVKQRAGASDREAQWSLGFQLVREADRAAGATNLGAAGRSPKADVGLHFAPHSFPVSHQNETQRCGHLKTKLFICGC